MRTQIKSQSGQDAGPNKGAEKSIEGESPDRHLGQAGRQGDESPDSGQEPAEERDAVPVFPIPAGGAQVFLFRQEKIAAVFFYQADYNGLLEEITERISEERAGQIAECADKDDERERQMAAKGQETGERHGHFGGNRD